MAVRTFKLTLAYDGAEYAGWQAQPGVKTVQGTLEAALAAITGEPVRVVGSGRTDAGVHALAQVVSFQSATRHPPETLRRALLAHLPEDMAVTEIEEAAADFNALRDVLRKRYRYHLFDGPVRDVFFARRYAWKVPTRLDAERMHRAGQALVGRHDFRSFETSGSPRASSVRTIFELLVCRGLGPAADLVTLEVEADGFLYNMVRTIVGTLVEVGRGAEREEFVAEVLSGGDRRRAGRTAPPQGLFLVRAEYTEPEA